MHTSSMLTVAIHIAIVVAVVAAVAEPTMTASMATAAGVAATVNASTTTTRTTCLHGVMYPFEGDTCQCVECWEGEACNVRAHNCTIDASTANCDLLGPWFDRLELSITIPLTYRLPYLESAARLFPPGDMPSDKPLLSKQLARLIRELHSTVGNAITEGYTIVIGSGATQLLAASMHALALERRSKKPVKVYDQAPYYGDYHSMADTLYPLVQWHDGPDCPEEVIEIVNTPNNPTGEERVPVCGDVSSHSVLYDTVFDWPGVGGIKVRSSWPRSEDIMVYSLSKLAGMASSRLGWALIRDPKVAQAMGEYILQTTIAPSSESMLRAVVALRAIVRSPNDFFGEMQSILEERWDSLNAIVAASTQSYSLESVNGSWYAWIKCPPAPPTCIERFAKVGVIANNGRTYGGTDENARIGIGYEHDKWILLLERLEQLFQ